MDWKEILADVDDDYLIGLSNKGIVKRAYKDKEESSVKIGEIGEEASIEAGGETVSIRYPLGESKCTCPSRSICRHVVLGILVLRESCLKGEGNAPKEGALPGEAAAERKNSGQNTAEKAAEAANTAAVKTAGEASSKNGLPYPRELSGIENDPENKAVIQEGCGGEGQQGGSTRKEALQREVNEYPLAALKKALGTRQLQNFVNLAVAGTKPEIQYSSVITVRLPAQEFPEGMTVKLLSPLEYSTCTCHKKELCVHKAAAILWCQLASEVLTEEGLDMLWSGSGEGAGDSCDINRVKEAAGQMKVFLEELLATGLSRVSPDVIDYLERLAIISHNAGLARFEGYFRGLSDSYDNYFKRKASFKAQELMGQLSRLYRRTDILLKAENGNEVYRQAGEFRAEYYPAGNLDLIGITMEHFESQAGYEGETVYFLEENSGKWYTYTSARPMFYEPGKKQRFSEKSQAPWGLNLSLEDLSGVRIRLAGAKCDVRRRLSSSQDTRGEVTGKQKLRIPDLQGWYYRDFGILYQDRMEKPGKWLRDPTELQEGVELVYVQPESWAKAEFSQTEQRLILPLYDRGGREIIVEVEYSKKEASGIRYLERINSKIFSADKPPCFLGKIYLRDGRMRMYPLDVLNGLSD